MSENKEISWLGSDFALLLFRFEDEVKFSDMVSDPRSIQILTKRESSEIWTVLVNMIS
jgi:hypothetical protein